MAPLLEVKSLCTSFLSDAGEVRAVDRVSFSVEAGKLMGLVGESGSGKTATVLSIMRLLPEAAREQISAAASVEHGQPVTDSGAGLLRHEHERREHNCRELDQSQSHRLGTPSSEPIRQRSRVTVGG